MRRFLLIPLACLAGVMQAAPAAAKDPAATSKAKAAVGTEALPKAVVYKDPSCGCCGNWIEHMRRHGFEVEAHDRTDMASVKRRLGVPLDKASCHTTQVGGLVIEGHVPAVDVKRLLAKPGNAVGLTVPGMPMGSPGMEMPDGRKQPYAVERINRDGTTSVYAQH